MSQHEQAFWNAYDKLRTARSSAKYYGCQLEQAEIMLLPFKLSAPTSGISGLWLWNSCPGKITWQWFGVIGALTSIGNAAYATNKKIKLCDSVLEGYRTLEYDFMEIKSVIEQKGKYDKTLQNDFKRAHQREKSLVGRIQRLDVNDHIFCIYFDILRFMLIWTAKKYSCKRGLIIQFQSKMFTAIFMYVLRRIL